MRTKLLAFLIFALSLEAYSLEIKTKEGQFRTGEYVMFSGYLYSPVPSGRLRYRFTGVVNQGDTISLDLTDGDAMMRSIYKKATYERMALSYVLNKYIDVGKIEYKDSEVDSSHYDFCIGDIDIEGKEKVVSLYLESGELLYLSYFTTRGIYYFSPYSELKDHGSLSIDYLGLDSLLEGCEICVPIAILGYSRCDYKVFY